MGEHSKDQNKGKHVLIIEDDRAIRQMIKDVLEVEGYTVETASDGDDGIEHLRKIAQKPCLVLLDLMMPGTSGWIFLDKQRSDPALSHVPIVVCSAYSESAKSVKAQAVIEKPIRLDRLLETVNAYCK